jgi:outer membrane protein TolC
VVQNNGWYPDRSFGVQMAWPIFDGLRTKGSIDLAGAQERVARAQLDQARELVMVEVARAQAEFTRADAVYNTLQQNTAEADEAYRMAALRFERGLGTQLEVNDAQFALLTARNAKRPSTITWRPLNSRVRTGVRYHLRRYVPLPPLAEKT